MLWLRVTLLPPTSVIPPETILVVAPAVLPLEICKELSTVELLVAENVMVLALPVMLIPAPASNVALIDEPFSVNPAPPAADAPMTVILGFVES